jgi:ribosomal protein S18 acetylase RimI-like enzyme
VTALNLREPRDDDWLDIVDLANRSVAGVPGAPGQDAWLENRKGFDVAVGRRFHRVAVEPATGRIVGYVAVESRRIGDRSARLFVVTPPEQLDDIGADLLACALEAAARSGARNASFVEYAGGAEFIAFLEGRGFRVTSRFEHRGDDGTFQLVRLEMTLGRG